MGLKKVLVFSFSPGHIFTDDPHGSITDLFPASSALFVVALSVETGIIHSCPRISVAIRDTHLVLLNGYHFFMFYCIIYCDETRRVEVLLCKI